MAINKRKILASAQKHLQKGALDKALRDYQAILEADPRDANVRLKVGDLLLRRGQRQEAFTAYSKVADQFMREGFDAKAVALYKQITKIDPTRVEVYIPLADLYQRLGLVSEAMSALQTAADHYHREGRKSEALDLLRRMASLDPTNTTSRLKIAELLRTAGREEEALAEYEETAAELARQGDWEAQLTVLERVLELEPKRAATLKELVGLLLEHDQAERAEPFARRLQESDPAAPEGYELLASVCQAMGRDDAAAAVYRQLADLYRTRGDEERARDILQRYVPAEPLDLGAMGDDGPDDSFALDLDDLSEDAETGPVQLEEREAEPGLGSDEVFLEESNGELRFETELSEPAATEAPEVQETSPPEPASPAEADPPARRAAAAEAGEAGIDQRLAEAAVYLRYGKHQRAIASLQAILEAEPGHPLALDRLADAYVRSNQTEEAVGVLVVGAEQAREGGDDARFESLRARIEELDPGAAEALAGVPEAPEPSPPAVQPDAETSPALDDIEIDIDDDLDEVSGSVSPEAVEFSSADLAPEEDGSATRSGTTPRHIVEGLEEANFFFEQNLYDEAEAIYRRILQAAPNHPQALLRLGEIAAARGKDPGDTTDTIRNPAESASPAAEGGPSPEASRARAPEGAPDLGDEAPPPGLELDGGEISFDDEVLAEDEEAPVGGAEGIGEDAPTAPSLRVAPPAESVPMDPAPEPTADEVARLADEPPGQALFDLAAELHEALQENDADETSGSVATDEDGFLALFRDFKRGVSETLGDEDRETRYDLGIAYREMGLLDDAVGEFQVASDLPNRRLDALHMMSLCYLDLGRPNDAASHLEQALAGGDVPGERAVALRFDLARAYEAFGDRGRALDAYRQVADADPDFQDVVDRIAALESEASAPPEVDGEGSEEEYESFDDLIEESSESAEAEPSESYESFDDLMAEVEELDETEPPAPAPSSDPEPSSPRRRKISFV